MPVFNKSVDVAQATERTPGRWLCEIKPQVTIPNKPARPGVEVGRTKDGKSEQWNCALVVTDPTPGAPAGALIFERLTWDGGKAESRIYALLKAVGHPVDEWKRSTTAVNIAPDMLIGRPFVFDAELKSDGYLQGHTFVPFHHATMSGRGPHPEWIAKDKPGNGSGGNGSAPPAPAVNKPCAALGCGKLPSEHPTPTCPAWQELPF